MKDLLDRILVKIQISKEFFGTGILYKNETTGALYLITAAHCLYGEDGKRKTKIHDISIGIFDTLESKYKIFNFSKADKLDHHAVNKLDLAVIRIRNHKMCQLDIPAIRLTKFRPDIKSAYFKGFPTLTGHKTSESVTIDINTVDSDAIKIKGRYSTDFNDHNSISDDNLEGFSGSGLFEEVSGRLYLIAIVTDIRVAGKLVICSGVHRWLKNYINKPFYYNTGLEKIVPDELLNSVNEMAISALGPRYTPDFTFKTPLYEVFDYLSGGKLFKKEFVAQKRRMAGYFENYLSAKASLPDELLHEVSNFPLNMDRERYPFDNLGELSERLEEVFKTLFYKLRTQDGVQDQQDLDDLLYEAHNIGYILHNNVTYDVALSHLKTNNFYSTYNKAVNTLWGEMDKFWSYLNDANSVTLYRERVLFVSGKAGAGKSHMMADIVRKRIQEGNQSLFLLGQNFGKMENPWNHILGMLELKCSPKVFLDYLNKKARASKSRILIFIDAINEGIGIVLWKRYLNVFLDSIKPYTHLCVVMTYRSTYEEAVFGTDEIPYRVIECDGFKGYENEAMRSFFQHHGLNLPHHPVLSAEFANPLFLKLLCVGLKRDPYTADFKGTFGIERVFNYFTDHANENLGEKFEYPWHKLNVVKKAITAFINRLADKNLTSLTYDETYSLIHEAVFIYLNKPGYVAELISENVFIEVFNEKKNPENLSVAIAYQRMGDNLLAAHLLDQAHPKLKEGFKKGGKFYEYFKTDEQRINNKGLLEALAVQLPEKHQLELFEAAPHLKYNTYAVEAYFESFTWRKGIPNDKYLDAYFKDIFKNRQELLPIFWAANIQQCAQLYSYFNGHFLHVCLKSLKMAERDATWTAYINSAFDVNSAIERLIKWAWKTEIHKETHEHAFLLTGSTLMWFLTSTNRALRDNATKALINLFQNRIALLLRLMSAFSKVNDPYVLQRIYAVAYGCAVRTYDLEALGKLAKHVYTEFFDQSHVLPDILTRDYAREIIEYAICQNVPNEFDQGKFRPPYKSVFPTHFPTNSATDKREVDYKSPVFQPGDAGVSSILESMVTEYGRGISRYGDFGRYTFESALRYWEGGKSGVNANKLSNLAVKWILDDYGYNPKIHGLLDNGESRKRGVERLGKKYQWIALFKILALVADNKIFYEDGRIRKHKGKYEGPWQPMVRDIDPTYLRPYGYEKATSLSWAQPKKYKKWLNDEKAWVKKTIDLPEVKKMIDLKDLNGDEWLVLEMAPRWSDVDEDTDEMKAKKEIWYQIRSYIVKEEEYQDITKWAKEQSFDGRWMPESGNRYQMFNREYYWSPAAKTFTRETYGGNDWESISKSGYSGEVALTTVTHNWEQGNDESFEGRQSFYKPTKFLFEILNLRHGPIEGQLLNENSELTCFDPSVVHENASCLVVKKDQLLAALKTKGLKIFWTVLGEKRVLGRHDKETYPGVLSISKVLTVEKKCLKTYKKLKLK